MYTMFITNNYDSFHLWWHENFVKHQTISKYYDQDCSIGFNDQTVLMVSNDCIFLMK